MTAAVVLAAGLGRRLATVTALPKWLTPVRATCPAESHLAGFQQAGTIERTFVVVGPGLDAVERSLEPWRARLDVELVVNDHSADRNNWYSLLLGLEAALRTGSEAIVAVNSDLFAAPAWFEALLRTIPRPRGGAALAVDRSRGRTEEAMKVAVGADGEVTRIGKTGVPDPDGEYVGLAWWDRAAADGLLAHLQAFVGVPDRSDHWYEHAIDEHLRSGARYDPHPVPSSEWVEIDDEADVRAATALGV